MFSFTWRLLGEYVFLFTAMFDHWLQPVNILREHVMGHIQIYACPIADTVYS